MFDKSKPYKSIRTNQGVFIVQNGVRYRQGELNKPAPVVTEPEVEKKYQGLSWSGAKKKEPKKERDDGVYPIGKGHTLVMMEGEKPRVYKELSSRWTMNTSREVLDLLGTDHKKMSAGTMLDTIKRLCDVMEDYFVEEDSEDDSDELAVSGEGVEPQ